MCALLAEYLKYIEIRPSGAILIGRNFVVDGHAERPVRVVTHAHADHVVDINASVRECKEIVATEITLDLIEVLGYIESRSLPLFRVKRKPIDYYECRSYGNEKLCAIPADHIPGAMQVIVEIVDKNIRIGYTGDFKLTSKTEIMKDLDVLVIEATYGHPAYKRPYKDSVSALLADFVYEGLRVYKRVHIYAYHGKMEEVMVALRERGVTAPYIVTSKVYNVLKLLEQKYGFKIGNYYKEVEMWRFKNSSEGVVVFKHFSSARYRKLDGSALHIVLTGRISTEPYKKLDDYTYVISFSDHGDFDDLVTYAIKANPKLVVIDGSRGGYAKSLKEYLAKRGFNVIILPGSGENSYV